MRFPPPFYGGDASRSEAEGVKTDTMNHAF
jgi:hypothetical protein